MLSGCFCSAQRHIAEHGPATVSVTAYWNELGSDVATGGLRDPFNMWDYFNPSWNASKAVVNHFGHDASPPGDPLYGARWDRGGSVGPNGWNLLPPNGTIWNADITAAINSFGHNCPAPPYTGIAKTSFSLNAVSTGWVQLSAFGMGGSPSVDYPNGFPTSGQAHIGDELVTYTIEPGPNFTISAGGRGQGGTTATSHPAGTLVRYP